MKRLFPTFWAALIILLALGCGGPPKPTTPDSPPTTKEKGKLGETPPNAPVATQAGESGSADVSPVAAPGEVVAALRWGNPEKTLNTLAGYVKMPQSTVDPQLRGLIREIIRDELRRVVDARALAGLIALDAPIDAVLVVQTKRMKPRPMSAIAVGLTSLRAARDTVKGGAKSIGPGLWRVGPEDTWGTRCVIAASPGTTPARLICGESFSQLEKLAPYMARTLPTQAVPAADIHGEIRLKGLIQRFGRVVRSQVAGLPVFAQERKSGNATFDGALMEAASALAHELGVLIYDLDSAQFDLTVDRSKGAVLKGGLQFAGKQSWIVKSFFDGANKAGPAPSIFWRSPSQSSGVLYGYAADPARFSKIFSLLQKATEGGLAKLKFGTPADRTAIAKLLRIPVDKHVAGVDAFGHFKAKAGAPATPRSIADVVGDMLGWYISGIEQKSTKLKTYMDDLVKTYNRATIQAELKKLLGSDAKYLPTIRKKRAPAALGFAGQGYEIKFSNIEDPLASKKAGKPKTTTISAHILLMPDGGRTWLGFGTNRNELAKLMAQTRGARPGSKTINTRTDLGMFKSGKTVGGGFFTLQSLIASVKSSAMVYMTRQGGAGKQRQINAVLQGMPHKGNTPITLLAEARDSSKPKSRFTFTIPKETLEDVGYLTRQALGFVP